MFHSAATSFIPNYFKGVVFEVPLTPSYFMDHRDARNLGTFSERNVIYRHQRIKWNIIYIYIYIYVYIYLFITIYIYVSVISTELPPVVENDYNQ